MPTIEHCGVSAEVDEKGFLLEPDSWTREIAAVVAANIDINELTDEHWAVVNFIREHWLTHDIAPMVRVLCKETGLNLKQIYDLFPDGPANGACKVAGLPKPEGCV